MNVPIIRRITADQTDMFFVLYSNKPMGYNCIYLAAQSHGRYWPTGCLTKHRQTGQHTESNIGMFYDNVYDVLGFIF